MIGVVTRVEQMKEKWYSREKQVIYIFVRGEDKKRYIFKDPFFEPYCYFRRGAILVNSFPEIRKHKVVNIEGESYLKVWTDLPYQISKLRRIVDSKFKFGVSSYEADVLFPLRYIIDKKIRGAIEWKRKTRPQPIDKDVPSNLRIIILDIELLFKKIKCLTIWDSYTEKYYTFYYNKKEVPVPSESNWELDWSLTEEVMLTKALKLIKRLDPDVITGYNVDFDLVNIRNRALDLQIGRVWDSISPMGYHIPPPRDRRKKFRDFWVTDKHQRIPGRNVVDLLEILLKMEKHQLSEYSLDHVAKNYLKPPMEKLKWNGMPIGPNVHFIWPQDPVAVLKYNKRDVELCVELNKQQCLIAFGDELRKFVGCQLDDIFSNKRIAHVELLRKTKKPLPVMRRETRGYKGAIVIEPKKGVYDWVIVMDFRSLYPSVILQFNIDPDTYIPKLQRKKYNITNAYILKDKDSKSEFWFKKKPEGDLPSILRTYLKKREDKKKEVREARRRGDPRAEVYDIQQIALKVVANAFYGSLLYRGTPSAYQCARATTSGARQAIRFAKKEIEKLGYKVIYGDTDSVMIKSRFNSYRKCKEEADYLSSRVTKEIPKFLRKLGGHKKVYLHLALDKVFRSFLIDEKKKRYAGIRETPKGEGNLEVKGFGSVRSDTSNFTRKLQKTLLKEILNGRKKEDIKTIVEEELSRYLVVPLTEIGVPCILTKDPKSYKANSVQLKAFSFSNKYLKGDYKVGDKPKRLYVKMSEKNIPIEVVDKVDVIAFHNNFLKLPKWLSIDYPKMVEKTVKPKIEKVLKFVDLEWKDIKLRRALRKVKKKRKRKTKKKGKKNVKKVSKTSTQGE